MVAGQQWGAQQGRAGAGGGGSGPQSFLTGVKEMSQRWQLAVTSKRQALSPERG
jgi:hypothetical protein